jgi:undecaprenyl diphosphate synthase
MMIGTAPDVTEAAPTTPQYVPKHVAIIMDGNGRWAKARGLPRAEGHRQGTENLRRIIRACVEFGIERELRELNDNGVQIRHIGRLDHVPVRLQKEITRACDFTRNNNRLILNVAFNYGGRDEIVHAVRRIIADGIPADQVSEDLINRYMYTGDLPDPDLIIRTSGELRVSNFLIWQGAYSEYYFTPTYWPDFDKDELRKAIDEYNRRTRRFGMTDEQVQSG